MRVRYLQVIALLVSVGAVLNVTALDQTSVKKSLQSLHENQYRGKRSLRAYDTSDVDKKSDAIEEERAVDLKLLDDLIKPDKIKAALEDPVKQKALFKAWFEDKDMSAAIYKTLSAKEHFFTNKDIVFAYGNYLTRKTKKVRLTDWLSTSALAKAKENLTSGKHEEMKKMFGKWYNKGKMDDDVLAAVRAYDIANKLTWEASLEKKYDGLLYWYKGFAQFHQIRGVKPGKYVAPSNDNKVSLNPV